MSDVTTNNETAIADTMSNTKRGHRRFILLIDGDENKPKKSVPLRKSKIELLADTDLVRLLQKAVEQSSDDDDWSNLAKVGSYISNNSSFSSVNYGYKRLGDLIKTTGLCEIDMRHDGSVMYIRNTGYDQVPENPEHAGSENTA